MKGKWKVTSNIIAGEKLYAVYRLKDANAVEHSGNRELAGEYVADRTAAELIAKILNGMEENKV